MKITIPETILLNLADLSDFVDDSYKSYTRRRYDLFKSFEEKQKGAAKTAVQRLLATSNIEKIVEGGEVFYKITNQGKLRLNKKFRLSDINRKWDEKWRILIFDIPEKSRNARDTLRNKLSSLGLGLFQKSVWVSPYDVIREVTDFLKFHKLDKGVIFFEAKTIGEETNQQIANTAWKLNELNEKYDEILSDYALNEDKKQAGVNFQNHYLSLLHEDPCLPQELYPNPWHGNKAQKLYFELLKQCVPN